jgi:hypothetical protein
MKRPNLPTRKDLQKRIQGLEDKARILTSIISGMKFGEIKFEGGFLDRKALEPGTLVLCITNSRHPWGISEYVGKHDENEGYHLLRELGSNRICEMGNECFATIVGLRPEEAWDRDRYHRSQMVREAFSRFNHGHENNPTMANGRYPDGWQHLWGGTDFVDDATAKVYVRERWGGIGTPQGQVQVPYELTITFGKSTKVEDVQKQMVAQGYGARTWTTAPGKDPRRITKADVENAVQKAAATGNTDLLTPRGITTVAMEFL